MPFADFCGWLFGWGKEGRGKREEEVLGFCSQAQDSRELGAWSLERVLNFCDS